MTIALTIPETTLDAETVRRFAVDWYRALDVHAPLDALLPLMVDDGLELVFPEGVEHGHAGFTRWYERVTRIFFDEQHTVQRAEIVGPVEGTPGRVRVDVVVNWQAKVWNPPEPRSTWLGFDAHQTWEVLTGAGGLPQVARYVVDALDPMPGSASL